MVTLKHYNDDFKRKVFLFAQLDGFLKRQTAPACTMQKVITCSFMPSRRSPAAILVIRSD